MMVRPREIVEGALQITFHNRLERVMNMLMDNKRTQEMTTVDIPEFLKPVNERFETRAKQYISDCIRYNPAEFWSMHDRAVELGF